MAASPSVDVQSGRAVQIRSMRDRQLCLQFALASRVVRRTSRLSAPCRPSSSVAQYPAGGSSGYKGGTFAFVAPDWHGTLPSDVKRIDAPTRWIEFQPRVFVKDEADLAAARKVLERITLQGSRNTPVVLPRQNGLPVRTSAHEPQRGHQPHPVRRPA